MRLNSKFNPSACEGTTCASHGMRSACRFILARRRIVVFGTRRDEMSGSGGMCPKSFSAAPGPGSCSLPQAVQALTSGRRPSCTPQTGYVPLVGFQHHPRPPPYAPCRSAAISGEGGLNRNSVRVCVCLLLARVCAVPWGGRGTQVRHRGEQARRRVDCHSFVHSH